MMNRVIFSLMLVLFSAKLIAGTLEVPQQYPTIQSAINAATTFDVITVKPGTYYENINFAGKRITVRSIDPNDPNIVAGTIINGSTPTDQNAGSVVTFSSGEDNNSVLAGFTITGGTGSWIAVSWKYEGLRWNRVRWRSCLL